MARAGAARSVFFFSSRRRHTRLQGDWSSDVCSSVLGKLGGTPSRNVLIGGAINVWAHSDGTGNTETMSNVTASVYLYPQAKSGFFLTGGLGFSNYYVNSTPSFDGTGWGFTAGAGYDIRVGRDVSLTPVVNYVYGGVGDVNESGVGRFGTGGEEHGLDF